MPAPVKEVATTSEHLIIGTAGHVDHGKTSLIRALTGVETDRLAEEKERGLSIDLGFAEFVLPSGRQAGIIDVPGHERFLKNMLAGAGGIDLVMLVIAADEGVMPQTREHLDILTLLDTRAGCVVLTKIDMVDPDWLELVEDDIRERLADTFLADAPIVPVSSITGAGIDELTRILDELADQAPKRTIVGPWRLPVDRVFSIPGFGAVVTGTLVAGVARRGDRVEIMPKGVEARIRTLQVHGANAEFAEAGTRVALNLAGVNVEDIQRGDVCGPPDTLQTTQALDARLDTLESCPREVKYRTRVRVYLGAAEVLARLNTLGGDKLDPGEAGFIQLRLETPAVALKGDRYVLRFYSPMQTIGGGAILDPHPRRHRRNDETVLENLALLEKGTPEELVAQAVQHSGLTPATPAQLASDLSIPRDEVDAHLAALGEQGTVIVVKGDAVVHAHRVSAAEHQVLSTLSGFHEANPMRMGMSREELRSRTSRGMDTRAFNWILERLTETESVRDEAGIVHLAGHVPTFAEAEKDIADKLEEGLRRGGFSPVTFDELRQSLSLPQRETNAVWEALVANGTVVRVAEGIFFHRDTVDEIIAKVTAHLQERERMTPGEFRDLLGTTRKYAMPLLEYLDSRRITRRLGDYRELF